MASDIPENPWGASLELQTERRRPEAAGPPPGPCEGEEGLDRRHFTAASLFNRTQPPLQDKLRLRLRARVHPSGLGGTRVSLWSSEDTNEQPQKDHLSKSGHIVGALCMLIKMNTRQGEPVTGLGP